MIMPGIAASGVIGLYHRRRSVVYNCVCVEGKKAKGEKSRNRSLSGDGFTEEDYPSSSLHSDPRELEGQEMKYADGLEVLSAAQVTPGAGASGAVPDSGKARERGSEAKAKRGHLAPAVVGSWEWCSTVVTWWDVSITIASLERRTWAGVVTRCSR